MDILVLIGATIFAIFMARDAWRPGFIADNDFVTHYAWVRYLVEEHWPATHSILGWNPHHGTGLPFLLYNTPPGLYLASGAIAQFGLTPLAALKITTFVGWIGVPTSAFIFAHSFHDLPRRFPVFAALLMPLFSSELFGLEFFFKNGMLNAAIVIGPVLMVWALFRTSLDGAFSRVWFRLCSAGLLYGCIVFTHVQSAYLCALGVVIFALASPLSTVGERLVRAALLGGAGLVFSAWWWVPSLALESYPPAAYTWIRGPSWILTAFWDGRLLSSYPVGFFPRFVTISTVSRVVVGAGVVGAILLLVRRKYSGYALVSLCVLSLWLTLGPSVSGPLSGLPLYGNLLWYRFITYFILIWLLLAAIGYAWLWEVVQKQHIAWRIITAAFLLSTLIPPAIVVQGRSHSIRVSSDYKQEISGYSDVVRYLRSREHTGRIYSEFPRSNIQDSVSVNHARHLLPLDAGIDEVAVWIYENNAAGQTLMARGLLWENPLSILWTHRDYATEYVLARSPNLRAALSWDPSWKEVMARRGLSLFHLTTRAPSLIDSPQAVVKILHTQQQHLFGGGYEYAIDVDIGHAKSVRLKVNYSRYWSVLVDGVPAKIQPTAEGLIEVDLPDGAAGDVSLVARWSMVWWQGVGLVSSALGLLGLVIVRPRDLRDLAIPHTLSQGFGSVVAVSICAFLLHGAWTFDPNQYTFGTRSGIQVSSPFSELDVGGYGDENNGQQLYLIEDAWQAPTVTPNGIIRAPRPAPYHLVAALPSGQHQRVTISSPTPAQEVLQLGVMDALSGQLLCRLDFQLNQLTEIPKRCIDAAPPLLGTPGRAIGLQLPLSESLAIAHISVQSHTIYIEGEAFRNLGTDSGADVFMFPGKQAWYAHNGVYATASVDFRSSPITIAKSLQLEPGTRYALWALVVSTNRSGIQRATMSFYVDDNEVGATDGHNIDPSLEQDFGTRWTRIGELVGAGDSRVVVRFSADSEQPVWADLDAVALEPLD